MDRTSRQIPTKQLVRVHHTPDIQAVDPDLATRPQLQGKFLNGRPAVGECLGNAKAQYAIERSRTEWNPANIRDGECSGVDISRNCLANCRQRVVETEHRKAVAQENTGICSSTATGIQPSAACRGRLPQRQEAPEACIETGSAPASDPCIVIA